MHASYEQFLDCLKLLHEEIAKAVDGLPPEAIEWSPGPEMNSTGVLMAHVAGSELHWLGDIVAGEKTGRDREAEFRSRGRPVADLKSGLDEMLNYARGVVARLGPDELTAERAAYADGRTMSVGACLLHVLRHTALHTGHMQITRQLWEARSSAGPRSCGMAPTPVGAGRALRRRYDHLLRLLSYLCRPAESHAAAALCTTSVRRRASRRSLLASDLALDGRRFHISDLGLARSSANERCACASAHRTCLAGGAGSAGGRRST
jgi:uncharacterized damage-inducible protein DinB